MSLNLALLNALSGLQVNQRILDLTAQNVANVNTEGYSRKIANTASVIVGNTGGGVTLASVTRNVSEFLLRDLRAQTSALGESTVLDTFYGRMQDLFGTPGSGASLGAQVGQLADLFQALAVLPEDASRRIQVVNQAQFLANQFNDTSAKIQALRREADLDIANSITLINDKLAEIAELNLKIQQNIALNQPASDLQDQRDLALNAISEQMDVRYFVRDAGDVVIFTANGRPLLDRTPSTLTHDAVGTMSPSVSWAAGTVGPILLNGTDITSEIASGRIAALIELRDTTLPDLHAQFEEMAGALHDTINALHNEGTSFKAIASLTGTKSFAAADTPVWTGMARIAVTDAQGVVVEVQDFDLSTYATVGDFVTAVDGMANVTAAINANGQVVITAAAGNQIALNEMDSAVTVGSRTMGFSDFLGLNDLFVSGDDYATYTTAHQASDSTPLGLAGTLTFSGSFGTTNVAYLAGNDLADVAAAINANGALTAAGITATVDTEGSGFRLRITDAGGQNFFVTDSANLVSTLGVKARSNGVLADMTVNSAIIADPGRLATATLSNAPGLAAGQVGVTAGDNTTVQAIANAFNVGVAIGATGLLSGGTRTIADYGAAILSLNATQGQNVKSTLEWRDSLFQTLKSKAASISAVNLDEEMANMVLLQNAYAANARVISTTSELFDVLINIRR